MGRILGYQLLGSRDNEFNFVRPLEWGGYPRFHLYIKEEKERFIFNLHLDQKRPSYDGSHAHSGEHEGPLLEAEAERIKKELGKN